MKKSALIAALGCTLGYSNLAAAQGDTYTQSPWYVGLALGARYHLHGSRDAFSSETVGFASGLIVGRELLAESSRLELAVELGYEIEANTGSLHQNWRTQITSVTPMAGLNLRVRLLPWLLPFVRVHAGATWHEVQLDGFDSATPLDGSAWAFQGSAGLGLMFQTGTFAREGRFRRLRLAFSLEGGAIYTAPTAIEVGPRAPSDERAAADRIPVRRVRLGDLDTSASYVRFTVGFRF